MFNSVLNLSASTYEAIIAAFIVLGLLQSFALRRKWYQVAELKKVVTKVVIAGSKAIMQAAMGSVEQLARAERRVILATARADAMQERAETAERELMEAAADHDDEVANRRGTAIDPSTLFFGDSHFGENPGFPGSRGFPTANPAPNDVGDLRSLFALLDGKGRNGAALDDLIFGGQNFTIVEGGDLVHGDRHSPGPSGEVTIGDIESLLRGDASGLEAALGAKCIGVEVIGPNGKPLVGADKEAVLNSFLRPRPSFDPLAAGTALHEEIERTADFDRPDESCSTQQPPYHAASSPRAG